MGNNCVRRVRDINFLLDLRKISKETLQSDEEMQKILNEIAEEELKNNSNSTNLLGPDCDFAKDINEFQSSKMSLLKKIGENFDFDVEESKFVCNMMSNIMQKVLETQK